MNILVKIIIKGDRNVGKTCLFNRLQGQEFIEKYSPTNEIQVTNIQWNYKVTDDIVKVEVWDVVDKGKKRVVSENLKLGNADTTNIKTEPALDAEFLDVYKGTHGVILVMDITKTWTFEYVQRELIKIPNTIPVLVLGNHCDMIHHRVTTPDHVIFYLDTLERVAPVRYAESSMYNGFGLKFLHKWFNLPFLQVQRETLLAQLITNEEETKITTDELDLYQQSDDSNYKIFQNRLTNRRRQIAESNSATPSSSIVIQTQHSFPPSMIDNVKSSEVMTITADSTDSKIEKASKTSTTKEILTPSKLDGSIRNIEEFVPDDSLDKSFLDDTSMNVSNARFKVGIHSYDSDSESDTLDNPLVSGFQDDLDDEFQIKIGDKIGKDLSESRGSPDGGDDPSKSNDNAVIDIEKESVRKSTEKSKKICVKKRSKAKHEEDFEIFLDSSYEAL